MSLTPGAVRRRAGGGGVGQGACGLGLYVLVCTSWSVCLGLYVLAFVSWGCCLGCAVLAFLFEYGICRGLTLAVSRRATQDSRMRKSYHWRGRLQCFVRPSLRRRTQCPHPRCGPPQGRWMWSGAGGVRSWPVCLGLYVLACVSWGCCLGFPVLKFLFEYGICGGLTLCRLQIVVTTSRDKSLYSGH